MTMNALPAKRTTVVYEIEIEASAQTIFPLICPVEELKWIDGWEMQYEMIYSESGVNEKNCIFKEKLNGPVLLNKPVWTTWVTTVFDPENHHIEFILMAGDQAIINNQVSIHPITPNSSRCRWHIIFTAITPEIIQIPAETLKEKMLAIISAIVAMLKHYCETGEMMKAG